VFLFTLLAGVVVLLAAVQATREKRRFEVALHARRFGRRVLSVLVVEFVSLGELAAVIAQGVVFFTRNRREHHVTLLRPLRATPNIPNC